MATKIDGGTLVIGIELDSKKFKETIEKDVNKALKDVSVEVNEVGKNITINTNEMKVLQNNTTRWKKVLGDAKENAKGTKKELSEQESSLMAALKNTIGLSNNFGLINGKVASGAKSLTQMAGQAGLLNSSMSGTMIAAGGIAASAAAAVGSFYLLYRVSKWEHEMLLRKLKLYGEAIDRTKSLATGIKNTGVSIANTFDELINDVRAFSSEVTSAASEFSSFVEPAGAYVETLNVVDRAFNNNSDMVVNWASGLKEQFGIVKADAISFASTFGLLLNNYGFNESSTVGYAKVLTGLVGDWSSFTDIDQKTMAGYFNSAIFGSNTRQLRNLGLDLGAAAMQQYMDNKGIQGTYNSLSQQEKVILKLSKAIEQSEIAIGDFERTQKSWNNQTRIMTNTLAQIQTYLGTGFVAAAGNGIFAINGFLDKLEQLAYTFQEVMVMIFGTDALGGANGAIGDSLGGVMDEIEDEGEDAANSIANSFKSAFLEIDDISKLDTNQDTISKLTMVSSAINGLLDDKIYESLFGSDSEQEKTMLFFDEIYAVVSKIKEMGDHFVEGWGGISGKLEPFKTSLGDMYSNYLKPLGAFSWQGLETFYDKFILGIADFTLTNENGLIKINNTLSDLGKKINWEQLNEDWDAFCTLGATLGNATFTGISAFVSSLLEDYDPNSDSVLAQLNLLLASLFGVNGKEMFEAAYGEKKSYSNQGPTFSYDISKSGGNFAIPRGEEPSLTKAQNTIYDNVASMADNLGDMVKVLGKGATLETFLSSIVKYLVSGDVWWAVGDFLEKTGMELDDKDRMKFGETLSEMSEFEYTMKMLFGEDGTIYKYTKKFNDLRRLFMSDDAWDLLGNQIDKYDTDGSTIKDSGLWKSVDSSMGKQFQYSTNLSAGLEFAILPYGILHGFKSTREVFSTAIEDISTSLSTEASEIENVNSTLQRSAMGTFQSLIPQLEIQGKTTGDKVAAITKAIGGVIDTETNSWKDVVSENMTTTTKSVNSGFSNMVKGVIGVVNKGLGAMNMFGISLPTIDVIPGFATGGVFEPRQERIIRVGDNTREREILSPVSEIRKAVRSELNSMGGYSGTNEPIVIYNYMSVDGQVLATSMNKYNYTNSWRQA